MKFKPNYVLAALALVALGSLAGCNDDDKAPAAQAQQDPAAAVAAAVNNIQTVVVIYAENRSFDNLYSDFPGQDNPLAKPTTKIYPQLNRDGSTLTRLPRVWGNLTVASTKQFDAGVAQVSEAVTDTALASVTGVYSINDTFGMGLNGVNHDMWHNFYQNQMQIDGGKNDMFAAWADSGGMVMGIFTGNQDKLPLWKVAQKYTMADHWFQGAFGGSFLNHQYLIASSAPVDNSTVKRTLVPQLDDGAFGYHLSVKPADASNPAVGATPLDAISVNGSNGLFVNGGGNLTPDGYAINTMQPPYQPSGTAQASGATGSALLVADPAIVASSTTLPAQSGDTIGDYLTKANVKWAWYAGGWGTMQACTVVDTTASTCPMATRFPSTAYLADGVTPAIDFQFHHQPFNYFKKFDPTTTDGVANRTAHLLDAGDDGSKFVADIDAGKLPPVTFYKPVGYQNEHGGYTNVSIGDQHIADVIAHLEKSPQWKNMLVIVTYDENGGIWDHVAPPKGDRFGPGSRIPAIIAGPTVKTGFVDHTMYDTTSILRFITRRWNLPVLPGLQTRIDALTKNAGAPEGDLSNTLQTSM